MIFSTQYANIMFYFYFNIISCSVVVP